MKNVLYTFLAVGYSTDEGLYRSCDTSQFCARFRTWGRRLDRPTLQITSLPILSRESLLSHVDFHLKSTAESDSNYRFRVSLCSNDGWFRFVFDDVRVDQRRFRFRIPDGDVVDIYCRDAGETSVEMLTDTTKTTIISHGIFRIEVYHSSFRVDVFNKFDHHIQSLNRMNLFAFEKYRLNESAECETGSDPACIDKHDLPGSWRDEFAGFTDEKVNGPSAVGIDHYFMDSNKVYGLPERTTPFLIPTDGQEYRLFNLDVQNYALNSPAGLYGSIPFLMGRHGLERSMSGFMWLNPSDTFVKLTKESDPSISSHWISETGIMDMFVFTGPTPRDVLRQYHSVTGFPIMPPIFSLGYHQSKWGYRDQNRIEEINRNFLNYQISCDVIWLDIQHTNGKRYFSWDPVHFPNPKAMVGNLVAYGRKLVTIVDPHVKVDGRFSTYTDLTDKKFFITNSKGDNYVGECWPGPSSYPDFTRSDVRAYWASLFQYSQYHGSSPNVWIWNDMNEPSVFSGPEKTLPKSTMHAGNIEHREIHNLYGMYYHRATFEGLLGRDPAKPRRPFVLSRSFFAGSHRYGPIWTGDNSADWEYLKASIHMHLSLAVSGMSFVGSDVGGYFGNPSSELFVRWHQAGATSYPFYRCHSELTTAAREPWVFGPEVTDLVRQAISLRYALIPYWYMLFASYAFEGAPVIRPIWFEDDRNDELVDVFVEKQILVGESLLVHPITTENAKSVVVYFPNPDSTWIPLPDWSGDLHPQHVPGGSTVEFSVSLKTIPIFVRSGSIIPMKKTKRASTVSMKFDPYTLLVVLDKDGFAKGELYIDDEESMEYKNVESFARFKLEFFASEFSYKQIGGKLEIAILPISGLDIVGQDGAVIHQPIASKQSDVFPHKYSEN